MKHTTRKKIQAVVAIAVAMLSIVACSKANATGESSTEPSSTATVAIKETPNEIIIATESEPPTLHPFDHKSVAAGYMNELTFDTLFIPDMDDLSPLPKLFTSYENISDTQWKFTVHEDVYFHDGTLMTAEDVVASLQYARSNINTSDYTSFWSSVEVGEDNTVLITTDGPYANVLLDLCNIEVLPKALIDAGNDFNTNPIGTGPYKFVSQTLGDNIVFEMNENYYDKDHMPTIEKMVWKIIPEGSSRTIALEAEEVDLVIEVENTDLERLSSDEGISVISTDGTRQNFMAMNTEVYPFDNADFRKGMNAAIDREAVILVAADGQGSVAVAQSPPCFAGYTEENTINYDPEQAKSYFAASGVDLSTVSFDCMVKSDAERRAAEVIQAYLNESGVTMNIVSTDLATFLSDIMSGNYETGVIGYTSSNLTIYLQGLFHSDSIDAANLARISIPEFDALLDASKTELDETKRVAILEEAVALLNDFAPFVPLYDVVVTRAYDANLGGVDVSPTGRILYSDLYWIS